MIRLAFQSTLAAGLIALSCSVSAQTPGTDILAEARAADAALIAAQNTNDLKAMAELIADDYAYIDLGGNRTDKAKVLSRREGDKLTLAEMTDSEDEAIVLGPNTVLLRGKSEGTAYYFGGFPRRGATRWSAIWRKDADRRWRVVAEQTTVVQNERIDKVKVTLDSAQVKGLAGTWRVATRTPMDMTLTVDGDILKASIVGQFQDMAFAPESPVVFFNATRPLEMHFAPDGKTMTFVSWGEKTMATRLDK